MFLIWIRLFTGCAMHLYNVWNSEKSNEVRNFELEIFGWNTVNSDLYMACSLCHRGPGIEIKITSLFPSKLAHYQCTVMSQNAVIQILSISCESHHIYKGRSGQAWTQSLKNLHYLQVLFYSFLTFKFLVFK